MERIISRPNMMVALERVEANKGAPGIDGMTTGQLRGYLKQRWPTIKEELLEGTYHPPAGAEGGNREARWGNAHPGNPDGA
jgi:RNA-directed DNA polymerase